MEEQNLDNDTCLYFHVNMDKKEIFYVGIGNEKRPYKKSSRSLYWKQTIEKYNYQIIIIEKDLTWEQACEKETFWIKKIGRSDLGNGTLVNLADGGEGIRNISIEARNKISKRRLIDLSKQVFGRLTVLHRAKNFGRRTAWLCNCECGTKNIIVKGEYLTGDVKRSCGCIKNDALNNSQNKPVLQLDKESGKVLSAFNSVSKASQLTNIRISKIHQFIQESKTNNHGGGYDWKVINKEGYLKYKNLHNVSVYKTIPYINEINCRSKKIVAVFIDGSKQEFKSISIACKKLGVHDSNVFKCLRGERLHTKNIKFQLIN